MHTGPSLEPAKPESQEVQPEPLYTENVLQVFV